MLASSKNCGLKDIKLKTCLRMDEGGPISQLITSGTFFAIPRMEQTAYAQCQLPGEGLATPIWERKSPGSARGPCHTQALPLRGWWGLTITKQREPTVGGDWKGKLARNVEAMEEEEPFLKVMATSTIRR